VITSKHGKLAKSCGLIKFLVLALIWILISGGFSGAQTQEPARNRVYLDVFGPGFLYSLNYERNVNQRVGIRLGAGGSPLSGFSYVLTFGMLTATVGGPVHSLHAGLGAGIGWFIDVDILESPDELGGYGVFSVGYQFQPRPRGVFFRLSYTPIFNFHVIEPLWGGISVGWAF